MIFTQGLILLFFGTKHIGTEFYSFIQKKLQEGLIFQLIPSAAQVEDMLTKPLYLCFFHENLSKSNFSHIHAPAFGALLDNKDETLTDPT